MIIFDTLRFTETLKSGGFSDQQAKAEVNAIQDAFTQVLDSQIASKTDIQNIQTEQRLMRWMLGVNLTLTLTLWPMVVAIMWKLFG